MTATERLGWFITAGLGVVTCLVAGGAIATMGILLTPAVETFRCTSAQGSSAVSWLLIGGTMMYPLAGWLVDRIGVRPVMFLGAGLAAIAYALAASSDSIQMFSAALFLLGFGDAALLSAPLILIVTRWLPRHRGLAMGIIMSSSAVGSAVLPSVIAYLGSHHMADWRMSMRGLAAIIAIVVPPILLLAARLPQTRTPEASVSDDAQIGVSGPDPLMTVEFWLLVAIQSLGSFSYMATYVYVVPYLVQVGYTSQWAASIFSGIGIAAFAGYLLFGLLADKVGAKNALLLGFLLAAAGTALLLLVAVPAGGRMAAIGFVILWGMTINLSFQLGPVLIADIAGFRRFGLLMGISLFVSSGAAALGPVTTGLIRDTTGHYGTALAICVVVISVAALLTVFLRSGKTLTRALAIQ